MSKLATVAPFFVQWMFRQSRLQSLYPGADAYFSSHEPKVQNSIVCAGAAIGTKGDANSYLRCRNIACRHSMLGERNIIPFAIGTDDGFYF